MTSDPQAVETRSGVREVVLYEFTLHPAGKPFVMRAEDLENLTIPMLFPQRSKDALVDVDHLHETVGSLKVRATLNVIATTDHAFYVHPLHAASKHHH